MVVLDDILKIPTLIKNDNNFHENSENGKVFRLFIYFFKL